MYYSVTVHEFLTFDLYVLPSTVNTSFAKNTSIQFIVIILFPFLTFQLVGGKFSFSSMTGADIV